MTTPTKFEVGQWWRWTRDDIGRGTKAGDLFVVARVDDAGDAFDKLICCSRARITDGGHPWSGSLEYLGMASGEGEGPRMGEDPTCPGYPAGCLACGATVAGSLTAFVCRRPGCDSREDYEELRLAWRAGARDFPRKPKAAPAYHLSTGPAVIPAQFSTVAPPGSRPPLPIVDRVAEDRRIATLMRMEGRTTDPGPAVAALPVPAWAGIDEWDLLPDADEPICPPRVRGMRKPGALR